MSTPNALLGILAKVYLNGASFGSPTWTAVSLIGDLKVPAKWDINEVLTRASRLKLKVKTMLDVDITGTLKTDLTDAAYTALYAAMLSDDVVDVMCLTGANTVNGVRGWRFEAQVVNMSQDQGPGAVIFDEFGLIPTPTANPPKSVAVASGAAVFTSI
ncbi:MAG TPA: hypothetical protein VD866_01080 [Urbifossiella sp.]|nr:hypothetical protein [Urbifossiella sp.]